MPCGTYATAHCGHAVDNAVKACAWAAEEFESFGDSCTFHRDAT